MSSLIGNEFKNDIGLPYKIISSSKDKRGKTVHKIRFLKTGYEKTVYMHNIRRGMIKDPFNPHMYGVGYLGNASYKGNEKIYHIWRLILRRCYDSSNKSYKNYGEKGVTVCERWHCFQNFLEDIPNIDGYDESRFLKGELQLDKDLKSKDGYNKEYSLRSCTFLTQRDNVLLIDFEKYSVKFKATSPEGITTVEENVSKFAKRNGLTSAAISNCLVGRYRTHKGWKFEYIEKGVKK